MERSEMESAGLGRPEMDASEMDAPMSSGSFPEVRKARYIIINERDVFKMTSSPRGLCLIINNVNYTSIGIRRGAYEDEMRFQHIFKELGFRVQIARDLKATKMRTRLREFALDDLHTTCDCAVLIIMAHGGNGYVCGTDFKYDDDNINSCVKYDEIVESLSNRNCRDLRNKPKICFIQACQGGDTDGGVAEDDAVIKAYDQLRRIPTISEFMCSFAAHDGVSTLRHTTFGGYYAMHLAEVLARCSWCMDLEEMLKMVERGVTNENIWVKGQRCVLSTSFKGYGWSKKLYFNPGITDENLPFTEKRNLYFQEGQVEKLRQQLSTLQESNSGLMEVCSVALSDAMTEVNCFRFYEIASHHQLPTLKNNVEVFIQKNFEKVCGVNRLKLLVLSFEDINSLLRSENLTVENEDELLGFLLDWVHYDLTARKSRLKRILEIVGFQKCTSRYLEEISSSDLIRSDERVQTKVQTALIEHRKIQPIFALGGYAHRKATTKAVEVYNTQTEKWIEYKNQNAPSGMCAVFPLSNALLVIATTKTYTWNPYTFETTEFGHMTQRSAFCAARLGENVYVLGGTFDRATETSECVVYNINRNMWSSIAPMDEKRQHASAAELNGMIYCAGGFSGSTVMNSVEKYNPTSNTWTRVQPMKTARSHFTLVTRGDHLYAIGGWSGTNRFAVSDVEMYTPETDLWERHSELLTARAGHSTVLYREDFIVTGGYTEYGISSDCEAWRSDSNVWEKGPSAKVSRCVHSTCVLQYQPEDTLTTVSRLIQADGRKPMTA